MSDVTRFAGFHSPSTLLTDAALSREDKLGGLSTWQMLLVSVQRMDGDDEVLSDLVREIEHALSRLTACEER